MKKCFNWMLIVATSVSLVAGLGGCSKKKGGAVAPATAPGNQVDPNAQQPSGSQPDGSAPVPGQEGIAYFVLKGHDGAGERAEFGLLRDGGTFPAQGILGYESTVSFQPVGDGLRQLKAVQARSFLGIHIVAVGVEARSSGPNDLNNSQSNSSGPNGGPSFQNNRPAFDNNSTYLSMYIFASRNETEYDLYTGAIRLLRYKEFDLLKPGIEEISEAYGISVRDAFGKLFETNRSNPQATLKELIEIILDAAPENSPDDGWDDNQGHNGGHDHGGNHDHGGHVDVRPGPAPGDTIPPWRPPHNSGGCCTNPRPAPAPQQPPVYQPPTPAPQPAQPPVVFQPAPQPTQVYNLGSWVFSNIHGEDAVRACMASPDYLVMGTSTEKFRPNSDGNSIKSCGGGTMLCHPGTRNSCCTPPGWDLRRNRVLFPAPFHTHKWGCKAVSKNRGGVVTGGVVTGGGVVAGGGVVVGGGVIVGRGAAPGPVPVPPRPKSFESPINACLAARKYYVWGLSDEKFDEDKKGQPVKVGNYKTCSPALRHSRTSGSICTPPGMDHKTGQIIRKDVFQKMSSQWHCQVVIP
ncbi:MAG: hypothetical protein KDD22_04855 [Bdellovibrionales bacterium]|nr:hypothetical protein [Bdellovibrionales bacterium]